MSSIITSSKILLETPYFSIKKDAYKFNETRKVHTYVDKENAIIVVPIYDPDHIIGIKHYRYLCNDICFELPAGGITKGEKPEDAAERELLEETGYQAEFIEEKYTFYPSNGILKEKVHIFFGYNLNKLNDDIDKNEEIVEIVKLNLKEIKTLITENKILGASSLIGLLIYLMEQQ